MADVVRSERRSTKRIRRRGGAGAADPGSINGKIIARPPKSVHQKTTPEKKRAAEARYNLRGLGSPSVDRYAGVVIIPLSQSEGRMGRHEDGVGAVV